MRSEMSIGQAVVLGTATILIFESSRLVTLSIENNVENALVQLDAMINPIEYRKKYWFSLKTSPFNKRTGKFI